MKKNNSLKMQSNKISRNSIFEIIRIIAILLIILSHYSSHGISSSLLDTNTFSFNLFLSQIMITGNIGVCLFMLISGFFQINSKFSFSKIIKITLEFIFLYSLYLFSSYCYWIYTVFIY